MNGYLFYLGGEDPDPDLRKNLIQIRPFDISLRKFEKFREKKFVVFFYLEQRNYLDISKILINFEKIYAIFPLNK